MHSVINVTLESDNFAFDDESSLRSLGGTFETEVATFSHEILTKKMNEFQTVVAKSILKLRESHILPIAVQQDIVDNLKFITDMVHDTYKSLAVSLCNQHNIAIDNEGIHQHLVSETSLFDEAFNNVSTEHKLQAFLLSHSMLVQPQDIKLATDDSGRAVCFQYIPITKVLELLLSNDEVFQNFQEYRSRRFDCSNEDVIKDYADGSVFKTHSFFSKQNDSLRLHFYVDEFEVCNPIGAKRGRHKVLAIYYTIGNLDSKHLSQLKYINLCLLVRYVYVRKYDPNMCKIFEPIVNELNLLSVDGFTVKKGDVSTKYLAALATVSGDNLSVHHVAGFQTHFNSGRVCRHCMVSYSEMSESFDAEHFVIRNRAAHDCHLTASSENTANNNLHGVHHECPLAKLDYFDVCSSFPPDIMHDLLEGVIPKTLQKIISRIMHDKKIALAAINARLNQVSRGTSDRPNEFNPRNFFTNGTIVGSASQKWRLFLLLPQILGPYVESGNNIWEIYILLREITDMVFAPSVQKSQLSYLKGVIELFLSSYKTLFGAETLTPKFHYLVHYDRMISMFGPLRHLWCMRFEAKHQYFKRVIASVGNYTNVTVTMAKRHQLRQCFELSNNSIVIGSNAESLTATSQHPVSKFPVKLISCLSARLDSQISKDELITTTNALQCDHVEYKVHSCFVLSAVEEEQIPLFFRIYYIVHLRGIWMLGGRLLVSKRFNRHLCSYSVKFDDEWIVVCPGEEVDHSHHDLFETDGCAYISPIYHISN